MASSRRPAWSGSMRRTRRSNETSVISSLKILPAVLACLLAVPLARAESGDAMDWLQKMKMSMQQLSYQGRFVYQHGKQLESMQLVHVNDGSGSRQQLLSLNGEARQILRDDKNLTCIWPLSKQVVVDQAQNTRLSPIWIPDDIKRLSRFYQFDLVGQDRVAGREARVVSISPRDAYRYGMRLWLDSDNGLMLQSSVHDEDGMAIEKVMFTEIKLLDEQTAASMDLQPPPIDSSFTLLRSHQGEGVERQERTDPRWQLGFVPGGFWLKSAYLKKMGGADTRTQHLVFTDGMASVSMFIEPFDTTRHLSGESSMGAVNAFSADHAGYTITAIGEVPQVTVREMATSVTLSE